MQDEDEIIEQVLAGQSAAFREIVIRYQQLIFLFVRNMLHCTEDAEDITQEVFVCAYRKLAMFDASRARLATWLLTIARNRCCNLLKRQRIETHRNLEPTDPNVLPDASAEHAEAWQQLTAALERLPVEQRIAFVLAEIQERPHAEIALIEGVELGTVKSRVSRAKERLRQILVSWKPASLQRREDQ